MTWHIDADVLRGYADGVLSDPESWSVEAHLLACAHCRELSGHALMDADRDLLASNLSAMILALPAQRPVRAPTWSIRRAVLGPVWAWAALMVAAFAAIVLLDRLHVGTQVLAAGLSWPVAISPLVPVAAVAATYALADRDAAAVATPRGGFHLVLIRTAVILGTSIPVVFSANLAAGESTVVWLLPGLGLATGSLALGSIISVRHAAAALSAIWAVGVAAVFAVPSTLGRHLAPVMNAEQSAELAWACVIAFSGVVVVLNRHRFDMPGRLI